MFCHIENQDYWLTSKSVAMKVGLIIGIWIKISTFLVTKLKERRKVSGPVYNRPKTYLQIVSLRSSYSDINFNAWGSERISGESLFLKTWDINCLISLGPGSEHIRQTIYVILGPICKSSLKEGFVGIKMRTWPEERHSWLLFPDWGFTHAINFVCQKISMYF